MGRYKWLMLLSVFCIFWSCKKEVDPEINIENVYVEFVKSDQVDINYKLSHLGYQTTGVSYYKKTNPIAVTFVNAIREDGLLKLSLKGLQENTEYVFKVFYKQNNKDKVDTKEYTVKTLLSEMAKFALEIKNTTVNYDEKGNFTIDIEGENLNNLNLSELAIKVNLTPVILGYPTLIADKRYKMTIKGVVRPINGNNTIQGLYQGKEILFQSLPFAYDGERYWITYEPTSLRGYYASVFNNELYYFYDEQVFKWNEAEQRLASVGVVKDGTVNVNVVGTQFDGQLFFPPVEVMPTSDKKDNYLKIYAYIPGTNKWTSYILKDQKYAGGKRIVQDQNYLIHKGELYLVYSLDDNSGISSKTDNFVCHYNQLTKQFEPGTRISTEIINFHLISMDNQLYLTGLVPVYDQGFKISATLAVLKVDDNFNAKEIYRGGTVAQPLTLTPKSVVAYDHKILIAAGLEDFKLFDPSDQKLYQVFLKNSISKMYYGGLFNYNNKLHLNADLLFTSRKIYEVSIVKGR